VQTDAKRLQQILKNLLSNAFKFTERGRVSLEIGPAEEGWSPDIESLNRARNVIAFTVRDSGIGIPPEKQQIIFEPFQQADGSTSRRYGGTGLGLAISRELARLLGGEIKLFSRPGEGSSFTLYLPQTFVPARPLRRPTGPASAVAESLEVSGLITPPSEFPMHRAPQEPSAASQFVDDSAHIVSSDKVLLIVENDNTFAHFLYDLAHERGFKAVVVGRGATAIARARELQPTAITLDINLPDFDGWRVLDRLKDDPTTRHIPVQIITTDEETQRGLRMGAMGALTKPIKSKEMLDETFARLETFITPRTRRILVATHDEAERGRIGELIAGDDVEVKSVGTGKEVLELLGAGGFDAAVIGLDLPEMKGFDLVDEIFSVPATRDLPVMVYSTRELSKKEELTLKRLCQTMPVKDVRSAERLLDEACLFLHRKMDDVPAERRKMIEDLHRVETVLAGKKVLIVDDDIRNIFAMTSLLEPYKMDLVSAETGKSAIEILQNKPDVDIVLMDIMMPDMDGYDTMRAIRKLAKFRSLPIIALTAKAMKGDREKCIEAGASDYIAKPVDTDQLLSLLRVWLYR
jgi:CheY-like chemotaxis protein